MVHWLYVSIIRQSISFASLVRWPGSQTSSAKERLSRVQRLVCLGIRGEIRTTPTGAMEALTALPLLDLAIQVKVRSVAHHLWSLGCWSQLYSNQGHSSILTWLQKSDPIFSIGINVKSPAFNLEPKYRVTMLMRGVDQRTWDSSHNYRGSLVYRWVQDGGRDRDWGPWAILWKKAQYPSRKTCYSPFRLRYM